MSSTTVPNPANGSFPSRSCRLSAGCTISWVFPLHPSTPIVPGGVSVWTFVARMYYFKAPVLLSTGVLVYWLSVFQCRCASFYPVNLQFVCSWPQVLYGRKSADRTEPHFGVIFFVFLSTFFGNLEVCDVKTCNIFWKYMSATWSTCLCLDH